MYLFRKLNNTAEWGLNISIYKAKQIIKNILTALNFGIFDTILIKSFFEKNIYLSFILILKFFFKLTVFCFCVLKYTNNINENIFFT